MSQEEEDQYEYQQDLLEFNETGRSAVCGY
jgi:hypothetical protein